MFSDIRNRWLFHRRAKIYDASSKVEWVNATMYDSEETVDRYDTASGADLSTFNSATELEFLDMIDAINAGSVLDVGCGAGAFHHLLKATRPDISYFGYDLSAAQIARAKRRFGEYFAVRDISTIDQSEFAQYDAIHAYSVFSFMAVGDQLRTLGRMLNSGAKVLLDTGCTTPDIHYAPRSCFKDFSGARPDGRTLFTAISFPFRSEIEALVRGTGHVVTFTESSYGNTRALNNSNRAGGALADKAMVKAKRPAFERTVPFRSSLPYFMARIAPADWHPNRVYAGIPAETVKKEILALTSG